MKSITSAVVFLCFLALQNCCGCPDSKTFTQADLQHKIAMMRDNAESGCVCGEGSESWYLERIADHGTAAVVAMLPYLQTPHREFSRLDAISVIEAANAHGFDASAALSALQGLTVSGESKEVRKMASNAVLQITRGSRIRPAR